MPLMLFTSPVYGPIYVVSSQIQAAFLRTFHQWSCGCLNQQKWGYVSIVYIHMYTYVYIYIHWYSYWYSYWYWYHRCIYIYTYYTYIDMHTSSSSGKFHEETSLSTAARQSWHMQKGDVTCHLTENWPTKGSADGFTHFYHGIAPRFWDGSKTYHFFIQNSWDLCLGIKNLPLTFFSHQKIAEGLMDVPPENMVFRLTLIPIAITCVFPFANLGLFLLDSPTTRPVFTPQTMKDLPHRRLARFVGRSIIIRITWW